MAETFSSSSLKQLNGIQWNLKEARCQHPLPSLCFSGRSETQDGRPGLWLAETFSTSPLKLWKGIHPNSTGNKISRSSTKFVFFGPIGKTRWPPWPLIGWNIFYFSSETVKQNSTKLDRKQNLNVIYQVSVFRAQEPKAPVTYCDHALSRRPSSVVRLSSVCRPLDNWHFLLLLQNRLMDFDETWYGGSTQGPLQVLLFFGQIRPGADPGWGQNRSGGGGPLLKKTSSSDWKATATNRMHSSHLEAFGKKCCYFWFHSEVKFLTRFRRLFGLSHFGVF